MSENNKRWISRLRNGLGKSSNRLVDGISSIFSDRPIDAKTLEELEDLLISADLGVDTAKKLIEKISKRRFSADINTSEIRKALANDIVEIFGLVPSSAFAYAITVLPFATVAEVPVPVAYLNTTF